MSPFFCPEQLQNKFCCWTCYIKCFNAVIYSGLALFDPLAVQSWNWRKDENIINWYGLNWISNIKIDSAFSRSKLFAFLCRFWEMYQKWLIVFTMLIHLSLHIIKAITGFKFKQHQIQIWFMQLNTNHYIIL